MRATPTFILTTAALITALTWAIGWWGVLAAALVVGVQCRAQGGRAWEVALAAVVAWGALLVVDLLGAPGRRLVDTLGGVTGVPGIGLIAITLGFPAVLAWAVTTATAEVSRRFAP
jgi:hypothetical protein